MRHHQPDKFLPFDHHHVAPIGGICPDSLKNAAKRARIESCGSKGTLPHGVALNHIAKSLGFRGGFGGYRKEYEDRLVGFMREHGLVTRRDVLAPWPESAEPAVHLTYRQVADRLFSSGLATPGRIFVGVDVFDLLREAAAADHLTVGRNTGGNGRAVVHIEPSEITSRIPPFNYFIRGPEGTLKIGELVCHLSNLVGDQLCGPEDSGRVVAELYGIDEAKRKSLHAVGRILRRVLEACPSAWVEVIRYNDRLAFLKGQDGGYEFVFKRLRNAEFSRTVSHPGHRDEAISKSADADDFARHLYFEYDGWLEADRHEAEEAFYASGGSSATYPRIRDELLRVHLVRTGKYAPPIKRAPARDRWNRAACDGRQLCFSELVTVRQFRRFLRDNPERMTRGESPEAVNNDQSYLPAAVTWYEANAYVQWFKRTHKLPARLLTQAEYLALAADLVPDEVTDRDLEDAREQRLCVFFDPHGDRFDGHPPYMLEAEFAQWQLRYDSDKIVWETSKTGLKTIRSAWFGEWLLPEGAAINGLFMCSQYDVHLAAKAGFSAEGSPFPPQSDGKYKSMKIGFRVAYEADSGDRR